MNGPMDQTVSSQGGVDCGVRVKTHATCQTVIFIRGTFQRVREIEHVAHRVAAEKPSLLPGPVGQAHGDFTHAAAAAV